MKPWREVAVPRADVLRGTFQQAEFAADISAVQQGKAPPVYQDAAAFFERTYITEGMGLLLTQVAQRLNGAGGDPVVQLQTAFGGGKTHTMLAVYHLATRACSLADLAGLPALLDRAGVMDVPRAKVAVLDGTRQAPAQPTKHGKLVVHTLWGELAWQLGGAEGYALVEAADKTGTSPGKDVLRELLERCAPCVVLVDELVAYVRQFTEGRVLSGGSYDSNMSFVQALTEAVKLVPNAMLLASLPESELEAGSAHGVAALRALEKTVGRVQAVWKPVASEESFEIVRRRLFEPVNDDATRDAVCRAFEAQYGTDRSRLPSETQETAYFDRMVKAYPIHPEVFARLYEDWSTLESFQRTRGVLKLMAQVVHELWAKGDKDLLIMPGSLPLQRGKIRDELITHLAAGWEPVLDGDIDGDRSESAELDNREGRFGAVQAARRVARATFFGSAPSSQGTRNVSRGVDRARILLGCLQPGQSATIYTDALSRLADRLHYLNVLGDKSAENARFWFDTRANLRREMENRKSRFDERANVRPKISATLTKLTANRAGFDGVHVFTQHADVPDDSQLRLVILGLDHPHAKEAQTAVDAALAYTQQNGAKPRTKGNRLIFLAPDAGVLTRLRDAVRTALAWVSIVDDIKDRRLVVDHLQGDQAEAEAKTAEAVVVRATRDCFRWVLCPGMPSPTDRNATVEAFPIATGNDALCLDVDRVLRSNELVIHAWAPLFLRTLLQTLYWKNGATAVKAMTVCEDMEKYLYMPRLQSRSVFEQTLRTGAATADFFGVAYGQTADGYEGFQLGTSTVQLDNSLLLIDPDAAKAYQQAITDAELRAAEARAAEARAAEEAARASTTEAPPTATGEPTSAPVGRQAPAGPTAPQTPVGAPPTQLHAPRATPPAPTAAKPTTFIGVVEVNAATAKVKLVELAEEVISVLSAHPTAKVTVTLNIEADFPHGAPDHVRRAVSENAGMLGFKTKDWE